MSEAEQLFTELLFGSGAWIGFLLVISIVFLMTWKIKESGIIFIPFTIFMGISYLQNVSASSNFMWGSILMFITSVFLVYRLAKKK